VFERQTRPAAPCWETSRVLMKKRDALSRVSLFFGVSRCLPDEHRGRVFHQLLHADEEEHGLLPIDDPVVIAEGDVHHRADLDLAVDGHRATLLFLVAEEVCWL